MSMVLQYLLLIFFLVCFCEGRWRQGGRENLSFKRRPFDCSRLKCWRNHSYSKSVTFSCVVKFTCDISSCTRSYISLSSISEVVSLEEHSVSDISKREIVAHWQSDTSVTMLVNTRIKPTMSYLFLVSVTHLTFKWSFSNTKFDIFDSLNKPAHDDQQCLKYLFFKNNNIHKLFKAQQDFAGNSKQPVYIWPTHRIIK